MRVPSIVVCFLSLQASIFGVVARCKNHHDHSACLINGQPDPDCCVDTRNETAACKEGYTMMNPDRGCGGASASFIFSWHEFPHNVETCCYRDDPLPLVFGILGGLLALFLFALSIYCCCKTGCCEEKAPPPQPGFVPQQAMGMPITVVIPAGMLPGQQMRVPTPYGTQVEVTIPLGMVAGQAFQVQCLPPPTIVGQPVQQATVPAAAAQPAQAATVVVA
eukprot:gb/GFBE01054308.1/.p1 GENE.gb/GFBE01054308.1/~~gb/GFBE01054308.1/.p1  ORF type:complete len:220 (+),score=13.83 gb/GFBE01054308.1/:1-660(+)